MRLPNLQFGRRMHRLSHFGVKLSHRPTPTDAQRVLLASPHLRRPRIRSAPHDQLVGELTFCYLILFKLNLCERALDRAYTRVSQVNGPVCACARSTPWFALARSRCTEPAYLRSRLAAKRRQWQMNIEVKYGCDVVDIVGARACARVRSSPLARSRVLYVHSHQPLCSIV